MTSTPPKTPGRPDSPQGIATPRWASSPGLLACAAVGVLIAAVALILSRIDLALLALPLVAAVALSSERRPSEAEDVATALALDAAAGEEPEVSLSIVAAPCVDAILMRYTLLAGESWDLILAGPSFAGMMGRVPLLHSGPQELARVEYRLLAADGAAVSLPLEPLVSDRVVTPSQARIRWLPLPLRLQGLTGTHESARAGDGGDFRDLHPFTPGDRLRRIDWKATARLARSPGDFYVRRTAALADATVLVVLDSRDDAGEQVAEWSRNTAAAKGVSSLDLAREAASSLAAAYIRAGDRVAFQDLSSRGRMIPQSGGSRHLRRLLRAIETTAPAAEGSHRHRPPIVPPGAIVYLLSSLLDDLTAHLALTWRANGHRVIAVDVLPPPRFDRADRYERIAHRLVMMEREDRMSVLHRSGVEILQWRDDGRSLPREARLQMLSRTARSTGGLR